MNNCQFCEKQYMPSDIQEAHVKHCLARPRIYRNFKEISEKIVDFHSYIDKVYDDNYEAVSELSREAKHVLSPLSRIFEDWSTEV